MISTVVNIVGVGVGVLTIIEILVLISNYAVGSTVEQWYSLILGQHFKLTMHIRQGPTTAYNMTNSQRSVSVFDQFFFTIY